MNRFITLAQYEKNNKKPEDIEESDEFDFFNEEYISEYEAYKLQMIAAEGYSLDEIFSSVIQYALDNGKLDILLEDPGLLLADWELECAYDLYLSYEDWRDSHLSEEGMEYEPVFSEDRHSVYHPNTDDCEDPFYSN